MGQNKSKEEEKKEEQLLTDLEKENVRRINTALTNRNSRKYQIRDDDNLKIVLLEFDIITKVENALNKGYYGIQVYINSPFLIRRKTFAYDIIREFLRNLHFDFNQYIVDDNSFKIFPFKNYESRDNERFGYHGQGGRVFEVEHRHYLTDVIKLPQEEKDLSLEQLNLFSEKDGIKVVDPFLQMLIEEGVKADISNLEKNTESDIEKEGVEGE